MNVTAGSFDPFFMYAGIVTENKNTYIGPIFTNAFASIGTACDINIGPKPVAGLYF